MPRGRPKGSKNNPNNRIGVQLPRDLDRQDWQELNSLLIYLRPEEIKDLIHYGLRMAIVRNQDRMMTDPVWGPILTTALAEKSMRVSQPLN